MVNIRAQIQIVSPQGYAAPYTRVEYYEYLGSTFLHAKLECMKRLRKLAEKEDFKLANIVLQTSDKMDVSIMRIKREEGTIYVSTFQSCLFKIPQQ